MPKTECGWCEKLYEDEQEDAEDECGICNECLENPEFIEVLKRLEQPIDEMETISLEELLKKYG